MRNTFLFKSTKIKIVDTIEINKRFAILKNEKSGKIKFEKSSKKMSEWNGEKNSETNRSDFSYI